MLTRELVNKVLQWLKGSFDVTDKGASAKKLSAFAFLTLAFWLHIKFTTVENATEFLIIDVSMVLTLLGIGTLDKLQQMKMNKTTTVDESNK